MKIVHFEDTGGVSIQLRNVQRKLGHQSSVVLTWRSPLNYDVDIKNFYGPGKIITLKQMWESVQIAKDADIVHVHSGVKLNRLDYLGCKYINKNPMVMHYHGTEVREKYGLCYKMLPDAKIVATPDLLEYDGVKDAIFIPSPFDGSDLPIILPREEGPLTIGHFPTNPSIKGTENVMKSIEILKNSGVDIIYDTTSGVVPYTDVLNRIAACDILIDQVGEYTKTGYPPIFGMISLEAMSMGKVVVNNISDKYREMYASYNPIVYGSPNAEELAKTLTSLIDKRETLQGIGMDGVYYVEEIHNPIRIGERVMKVYESVL